MIPQPIKTSTRARAQSITMDAPMGGLDLATPIHASRPGFALRLDNFICRQEGVELRAGYEVMARIREPITSLLSYPGQLFAATETAIYDETGAAVVTGLLGGDWIAARLANPGGVHLLAVNGVDAPRHYNGVSWQVAGLSGTDPNSLTNVIAHQRHLFFVQRDSLTVWYLPLNQIGGALKPIHLEAQAGQGGHVVALASLSVDGGEGADDRLVIVTDRGELMIYTGMDPNDAGSFALVGRYKVAPPRGPRCFDRFGGQLVILSHDGAIPIPAVLGEREAAHELASVSRTVDSAMTAPFDIVEAPEDGFTVVADQDQQWVMSETGAWSRFTLPATCFAVHDRALWFGTADGRLCRYGGVSDDGLPIHALAVTRFERFGTVRHKRFIRVRPHFIAPLAARPRIEMITDYVNIPDDFEAQKLVAQNWAWDDLSWDKMPALWLRDVTSRVSEWRSVSASGVSGALMIGVMGSGKRPWSAGGTTGNESKGPATWTGYDVMIETGGQI